MARVAAGLIRAAGGVVFRASGEICLVHRPRYDDWSLPKGKLTRGEAVLTAAVREVHEETGVRAVPLVPLPSVRYPSGGVAKTVHYWAMRVQSQEPFVPDTEVDDVSWLPVPDALGLLSYVHDIGVVKAFAALPPVTGVVLLVRHASAGHRGSWPGPDAARPLDPAGAARARELCAQLDLFAPQRLVSAPARRCVQTLAPLAATADLPIEIDETFDESGSPAAAAGCLRALAAGPSTVVCSQRALIPPALSALHGGRPSDYPTPKGTAWLIPFAGRSALDPTVVT